MPDTQDLHHDIRIPTVTWCITDACNFRCSYCYSRSLADRDRVAGKHSLDDIVTSFGREVPGWVINYLGGEGFMYRGFTDLTQSLCRRHKVGIYSNLSIREEVEVFLRQIDPTCVTFIDCSLHPLERRNRDPDFTQLIYLVHLALDKGFRIAVTCVMHPLILPEVPNYISAFGREGIAFYLKPFWGIHDGHLFPEAFTSEHVALITSNQAKKQAVAVEGMCSRLSFTGEPCTAGMTYLELDSDGNAFRCASDRVFSKNCMGNLFAGSLYLHRRPQPCTSRVCHCGYQGAAYSLGHPTSLRAIG